jgi:hypothetical protein
MLLRGGWGLEMLALPVVEPRAVREGWRDGGWVEREGNRKDAQFQPSFPSLSQVSIWAASGRMYVIPALLSTICLKGKER